MLVNYAYPAQDGKLTYTDFTQEYFERLSPSNFTFVRIEEAWRWYKNEEGEKAFQVTPVGLFRGETVTTPDAGYYDAPSSTTMALVTIMGSVIYQTWNSPSLADVNTRLSAD